MALTRIGLNQSINLASNVTGTLPVANGGTAITSGFANGVTDFDSWRMTTTVANASGGDLNGSWERQDTNSENIKHPKHIPMSASAYPQ